jgi:hypothetical protein
MIKVIPLFSILFLSFYIPEPAQNLEEIQKVYERNRLDEELRAMVRLPEYQAKAYPGGWKYFCNIAARDILSNKDNEKYSGWFGNFFSYYSYDIKAIFPTFTSILSTPIDKAYRGALAAIKRGLVKSLMPREAQERANEGAVIWVVAPSWVFTFGHEAIVAPDWQAYSHTRGCKIAQAGKYCCIGYARDSRIFGERYRDTRILYIEFPRCANGTI